MANVLGCLRGFAEEALLPTISSQQQQKEELNKHIFMTFQAGLKLTKIASDEHMGGLCRGNHQGFD